MADEQNRQRSPQEMVRELQQQNPEAAQALSAEIAQAGATLRSATQQAKDQAQQQPSVDEQIRNAGQTLAAHVEQTREVSLDALGQLSPDGMALEQSQGEDENTSDKARWLAQVAKEPEPEPTREPSLEQERLRNRDDLEH